MAITESSPWPGQNKYILHDRLAVCRSKNHYLHLYHSWPGIATIEMVPSICQFGQTEEGPVTQCDGLLTLIRGRVNIGQGVRWRSPYRRRNGPRCQPPAALSAM